jgi:dsDNA-specific endonuclease/ATPase MutS2
MFYKAEEARDKMEEPLHVVDLHIEKLCADYRQLSNAEIILLQLDVFEKYFYLAWVHHLGSITIIHGVGKGKLKSEIHRWLKDRPEVRSFDNRYHPLYGNGATVIQFAI